MGLAVRVKWMGEHQGGESVSNGPSGRPAEVTALTPPPPPSAVSGFLLVVEERGLAVISGSVSPPCYSQQQRGASQGNSTPEFKRNNRIGFDLFNSEIKVTRKNCGSYLCGLRGIFFFFFGNIFLFI